MMAIEQISKVIMRDFSYRNDMFWSFWGMKQIPSDLWINENIASAMLGFRISSPSVPWSKYVSYRINNFPESSGIRFRKVYTLLNMVIMEVIGSLPGHYNHLVWRGVLFRQGLVGRSLIVYIYPMTQKCAKSYEPQHDMTFLRLGRWRLSAWACFG